MMTGSELSLVLILILLVRVILIAAPWPGALLIAFIAARHGRRAGLAAAAGALAAPILWAGLGAAGAAPPLLEASASRFVLFLALLAGLTLAVARQRLATPGAGTAFGLLLALQLLHPGVGARWASVPGRVADTGWSLPAGLAVVALVFGAAALLGALPRARALAARQPGRLALVLALLLAATALAYALARWA